MDRSNKHFSSSFNKFVAQLQRTFSLKNNKSSTVIIQQEQQFRTCLSTFTNRFQLSDILYNPSRPIEYLSEIKDKDDTDSFSSNDSISNDNEEQFNLSQMNISYDQRSPKKHVQLPNLLKTSRLHSTAIHDIGHC